MRGCEKKHMNWWVMSIGVGSVVAEDVWMAHFEGATRACVPGSTVQATEHWIGYAFSASQYPTPRQASKSGLKKNSPSGYYLSKARPLWGAHMVLLSKSDPMTYRFSQTSKQIFESIWHFSISVHFQVYFIMFALGHQFQPVWIHRPILMWQACLPYHFIKWALEGRFSSARLNDI